MKNQDHINELLGKYFAKEELNGEEQKDQELWMQNNPEEFHKLKRVMEHTEEKLHQAPMFNADLAWQKIEPKLKAQKKIHRITWTVISAVAASLIVAWMAIRLIPTSDALRFENRTASIQNYLLPDSSEIALFPNAVVDCRIAQNEGDRKVEMQGKVFFKVKKSHGRKFRIKADEAFVEVLGTSFIVETAADRRMNVQVRTGKVKVTSGNSEVELEKNEQVEITGSKITMKKIDRPEAVFGFVQKLLIVQNESVEEVIKKIETITGVQIGIDAKVGKNKISTRLNLNQMEQVVQELAELCKCQYEKTDSSHYRLVIKK